MSCRNVPPSLAYTTPNGTLDCWFDSPGLDKAAYCVRMTTERCHGPVCLFPGVSHSRRQTCRCGRVCSQQVKQKSFEEESGRTAPVWRWQKGDRASFSAAPRRTKWNNVWKRLERQRSLRETRPLSVVFVRFGSPRINLDRHQNATSFVAFDLAFRLALNQVKGPETVGAL